MIELAILGTVLAVIALEWLGFSEPISLDGEWQFRPDPDRSLDPETALEAPGWEGMPVPSSWQAARPEFGDYLGQAWYTREFDLGPVPPNQRVLLEFGAVNYHAEVFVNGVQVGDHEGGYTPFRLDVTGAVRAGANRILLRVVDGTDDDPHFPFPEVPHGRQGIYGRMSGPWQSVRVEIRPRVWILRTCIAGRPDGRVEVSIALSESPPEERRLIFEVLDRVGRTTFVWQRSVEPGTVEVHERARIENPAPWSPEAPHLYGLRVSLSRGEDMPADIQEYTFGFRRFEARGGGLYLNGKPFYMRGALDIDLYPDTEHVPAGLSYIRDGFRKAKAMGLNLLRCHVKIPDPRYLQAADEEGLLIWYEIPSFQRFSPSSSARALATLREAVARDQNHPSVVMLSVVDASRGLDLSVAEQREWLRGVYEEAKTLVPGWLVVDNSASPGNFHVSSDVEDFHIDHSLPVEQTGFDSWVDRFSARADWTYSPHGDGRRTGEEPLVVSEFGNWGLPDLPEYAAPLWREGGEGNACPSGVQERFREFRMGSIFADLRAMARESQWCQWDALRYQIESFRLRASIRGYVIAALTDLCWEAKGLLTFDRREKVFWEALRRIQADDALIVRPGRPGYFSREVAEFELFLSHFSTRELTGGRVEWRVGKVRGELAVEGMEPGTVGSLGRFDARLPAAGRLQEVPVEVLLHDSNGSPIARAVRSIPVYPVGGSPRGEVALASDLPDRDGLARRLSESGYGVVDDPGRAAWILHRMTQERSEMIRRTGGRAILLAEDPEALPPNASLRIEPWGGEGSWEDRVDRFTFVRGDRGPFQGITLRRLLGFETGRILPRGCFVGVPAVNYDDVLSGVFAGWLHSFAPFMIQARWGYGKVVMTTFRLREAYGSDPFATIVTDRLIDLVRSGSLRPRYEPGVVPIIEIVPPGRRGRGRWRYSVSPPPEEWASPDFDDRVWARGTASFGRIRAGLRPATLWETESICIRQSFELEAIPRKLLVVIHHDDAAEVYLNGTKVLDCPEATEEPVTLAIPVDPATVLRCGSNVLGARCHHRGSTHLLDVGLMAVF